MNKSVWIFQNAREVKAKGAAQASWYIGWYDLHGKRHSESCGPGSRGKGNAEKRQRRIQSELDTGVHQPRSRTQWSTFRKEYENKVLANLADDSQREAKTSLNHFQRIVRPANVSGVQTKSIDTFISTRRLERGKKPGSNIAPATINKDLRHIKAALNVAVEWGYLTARPKIRMVKEPKKVPTYVTPAHFQDIYLTACPKAQLPQSSGQTFLAADWWSEVDPKNWAQG